MSFVALRGGSQKDGRHDKLHRCDGMDRMAYLDATLPAPVTGSLAARGARRARCLLSHRSVWR